MAGVGVVFSSGFFGFFAHAGFLAAMRDLKIEPCGYAGTSSGAIVAAMAASGMTNRDIRKILFKLKKEDFWDHDPWYVIFKKALNLFKGYTGYLGGKGFRRLLEEIPVKRIEDCPLPLIIAATNLTRKKETIFTRGNLADAIQASSSMPMFFKPVRIEGSLYVDGGVVNKAPVKTMADMIQPERIIVHFIKSDNVGSRGDSFLRRRFTPWHIHYLAFNISRQEAYGRQCDVVRQRGVEIMEIKTDTPALGPDSLEKGPLAYRKAREKTLEILRLEGF
jgi:NTE family protein